MRLWGRGIFVGTTLFTLFFAREAFAATATWAANANAKWSDGASWVGGVAPSAGDDLVFPAGPTGVTATNDFPAGTAFGKISVAGDGYVFDGNAIDVGGDITVTSATTGPTFALPVVLTSSILLSADTPALVTTTFNGNATVDLGPSTLSIAGAGKTSFLGKISGPGNLTKTTGLGETTLAVDNNYLGATTVNAGTLTIKSAKSLGSAGVGTTIQGTGSLRIMGTGAQTFDEPLVLASTAYSSFASLLGTNTWAGPIALDVDSYIFGQTPFEISGVISGTHLLQLSSNNGFVVSGANTHSGGTTVRSGGITFTQPSAIGTGKVSTWLGTWITVGNGTYANELSIQGSTWPNGGLRTLAGSTTWSGPISLESSDSALENAGALVVSGKLTGPGGIIKYGTGELSVTSSGADFKGGVQVGKGTFRCTVAACIPDAAPVDTTSGGTFVIDPGLAETIGSLTGELGSAVKLGDGVVLTTGGNGHSVGFSGVISGNASIVFSGPGSMFLHQPNTYTGPTTVNGGTMGVHGVGSVVSTFTVNAGARMTLANGGTAANVIGNGGTFAPGAFAPRIGHSGPVSLNGASTFSVGLDGTAEGEATHLSVTGAVALGNASLSITIGNGFTPAIGDAFTIIDNDGADAVDGTFAGLAENGVIAVGASFFRVTYVGGDGNDVVLTKVVAPAPDAGVVVDGGFGDGGSNDGGSPVDAGPSTDAGTSPAIDAGAPNVDSGPNVLEAGDDAGTGSKLEGSGCDCRSAGDGGNEAPHGALLTAFVALVLGLRRRVAR